MSIVSVPQQPQWKRWIPEPPVLAGWGVIVVLFAWTYWDTMHYLVSQWINTPDLGHGFVVPLFSAFLLWHRQEMVDPWPNRGTWWCIPFFVAFAAWRWACYFLRFDMDHFSIIFFLLGMTLALGGWRALRWAWPAILFLGFMLPLPEIVAGSFARYLQWVATKMSVYALQTLGIPAIPIGANSTVIEIPTPPPLEVARACSGLRMMTVFVALCTGACFILRDPLWKKIVLLVSSIPISVLSNVARITVAGMLQQWISARVGHFFHDNLGVLMVVPAILMIWGELALLSALLIEPVSEGPLIFGQGSGAGPRRTMPVAGGAPDRPRPDGRKAPVAGPMGGGPRRPSQM